MTTINVFSHDGEWFGAVFIDGEYDHQADLECAAASEATEEAQRLYPDATVRLADK